MYLNFKTRVNIMVLLSQLGSLFSRFLPEFAHSPQPTAHSPQPTAHSPQPTAHSPQPTAHSPQPTAHNPQPTTHNPQPTTHNPQPTTHKSIAFQTSLIPWVLDWLGLEFRGFSLWVEPEISNQTSISLYIKSKDFLKTGTTKPQ